MRPLAIDFILLMIGIVWWIMLGIVPFVVGFGMLYALLNFIREELE